MSGWRNRIAAAAAVMLLAGAAGAQTVINWRNGGDGRYPDATPPTHWGRVSKGVVYDLRCQAAKPAPGDEAKAPMLRQNLIIQWLVLGPVAAPTDADAAKALDAPLIPGEASLEPAEGDKAGGAEWKRLEIPYRRGDSGGWVNTPDLLDLAPLLRAAPGQAAYAHAYLYSSGEGVVSFCVDHAVALKAWVNGKVVYNNPKAYFAIGAFSNLDTAMSNMWDMPAPSNRFTARLVKGWNRLLLKAFRQKEPWSAVLVSLSDDPSSGYDTKNILWTVKLPSWGWSDPVIVGDKLFVLTDDEEIFCLDKRTGKVLWRRMETFVDATPEQERAANPIFKEKLEPIVAKLKTTDDPTERRVLRRQMRDLLAQVDKARYPFPIYNQRTVDGYANSTPVSDGKNIYVFFDSGTVVCWDLDGNRKWSRRIVLKVTEHGCSAPTVLAGDKVIVVTQTGDTGTTAFNKNTGEVIWKTGSTCPVWPAKIAGREVLLNGLVLFDPADGKLLTYYPDWGASEMGAVVGNTVYFRRYGDLTVAQFPGEGADALKPKVSFFGGMYSGSFYISNSLYYDGLVYMTDIFGKLVVADPVKQQVVYARTIESFRPVANYHSAGVTAGPILGGKYLYLWDNVGNAIVLEPGREFKLVAENRIENILPRRYAIEPPQELIGYSQPVFDGNRIYLRGEQNLYCIGEK